PSGAWGEALTLVKAGQPQAVILTPTSPGEDIALAARELQSHLQQISGAEVSIAAADSGAELAEGRQAPVRILLGSLAASDALLAEIRAVNADPASFAILAQGQDILIAGLSDEAVLFGA